MYFVQFLDLSLLLDQDTKNSGSEKTLMIHRCQVKNEAFIVGKQSKIITMTDCFIF